MISPEPAPVAATNPSENNPATASSETLRLTEPVRLLVEHSVALAKGIEAAALLVLWSGKADWSRVRSICGNAKLIVAVDTASQTASPKAANLPTVVLNMPAGEIADRLSQALVECATEELVPLGCYLVAVYGVFDPLTLDSVSIFKISDYVGRFTVRELRQLQSDIPVETLKTVINLAIEIGREGREGKPVGTLFVVGDTRRVLSHSRPLGFDPVRGYSKRERNLFDPRVREGIKEIAQLDGAFIVDNNGQVVAACRHIDCSADGIHLSKGLGSRHWAAAAITRRTKAIAVCVSESSGTVRVFQNGEVRMRIEPEMKRPFVWKELDADGSSHSDERR